MAEFYQDPQFKWLKSQNQIFECYYSLQIGILDKVVYCLLLWHALQPTALLQIPSDPHFKGAVCS